MIVLEAKISDVSRNRDFGMVEARVTLFAKTKAGQPAHLMPVMIHVPTRGRAPLRERLIAEAATLGQALVDRPTTLWAQGPRAA